MQKKKEKEYDIIILGTGLKEYILMGLLIKNSKIKNVQINQGELKILQINKTNILGGESPSLNISQLYNLFNKPPLPIEKIGDKKDWNIDLIPKVTMSYSILEKLLTITEVFSYIEWKNIEEAFVYQYDEGGMFSKPKGVIYKVPSSQQEVMKSDLMGIFEKNRCRKLFQFIEEFSLFEKNSFQNININDTFRKINDNFFELEKNTIDFIGHAIALYPKNDFINKKGSESFKKIKKYINSIQKNSNTPFIFPIWGLSGIYKNYKRQFDLQDSKYIPNQQIDDILYSDDGKFKAIKIGTEIYYGKILIAEPTYVGKFDKVKVLNKIIRRICLIDHPVPNSGNCSSFQIILPQNQINRKNDIYILGFSFAHCICKKGYYIVVISSINDEQIEINTLLQPAMDIVGNVVECFDKIYCVYEPINKAFNDNVFITSSFLAQSHFENDFDDVIDIYQKITGNKLNIFI